MLLSRIWLVLEAFPFPKVEVSAVCFHLSAAAAAERSRGESALVELDLVGVRSLLFSEVGGLCNMLSPAMMASTCRKSLGQQRNLQSCASSLYIQMAGKARAMVFLRLLPWLLCTFRARTSPILSLICWSSRSGAWLCGGKGFDNTPRRDCLGQALDTGSGVVQQRELRSMVDFNPEAMFACSLRRHFQTPLL